MKHKTISKLKQYISDDRPKRLREYVRKHDVDLTEVVLSRGQNLLHYCCKHGSGTVLRYLMSVGVPGSLQDSKGRSPLHVALDRALELDTSKQWDVTTECYNGLILPLLECYPKCLDMEDSSGATCRRLLHELVQRREAREPQQNGMEVDDDADTERAWRDKLADEMVSEHHEMWGAYIPDPSWDSHAEESCGDWADRVRDEYNARKRAKERSAYRGHGEHKGDKKGRKGDQGSGEEGEIGWKGKGKETLEEARERMRREFKNNKVRDVAVDALKKRMKYEERYKTVLEGVGGAKIKYGDIPWPSLKGEALDLTVLFDKMDKSSAEYQKYLRDQQIRWHPDKFLQRFGSRLYEKERQRIIARVTLLSQNLNQLKS
ncbi:NF-kappa-B inhibitor-like protein 1 [Mya arenaria]|uniref:NF-kappa-B inhibitor-like protein 1 n=1 Tax=Mya arenaria TaxID=6604 RepID=UPI0022E12830|nr:NF-kappa-B inhibitor-like protein 1 [Mya arenaria]XP_052790542.1 NF-kappa-B inhibitor-like protein 1 [Mya arenaria]